MTSTVIQLGRFGDVIGLLPLAYHLSQKGGVQWIISAPFIELLEGCSYVTQRRWPKGQDTLPEAIRYARSRGFQNIIVPQVWKNPDQRRLTSSFQTESWRLAGKLNEFAKHPLIFDQRSPEREAELVRQHIPKGRKVVLVASEGVSGPFQKPFELIARIRALNAEVVDLSDVKAVKPFDLLGLFDAADCLVTIDTLHLHLSRASTCPVVAIMNDEDNNFKGTAVPPPQTVAQFRYAEAAANLEAVVEAARKVVTAKLVKIRLVANIHGQTERHLRARANWPKDVIAQKNWGRDATSIGNDRPLPFFKDLLQAGLDSGVDVIAWTNDDCSFGENAFEKIKEHCAVFDFGCVRRDASHCGREAFFFKAEWLRQNITSMPDVIVGTERFDLVVARWLRNFRGIVTTKENIALDFFPIELPPGIIHHEQHISWWDCPDAIKSAATQHNIRLWNEAA